MEVAGRKKLAAIVLFIIEKKEESSKIVKRFGPDIGYNKET